MPKENLVERAVALCELNNWPVTYDNVLKTVLLIKEQEKMSECQFDNTAVDN